MAVSVPATQITGLTQDQWNDNVDITAYGVPSTASAVLLEATGTVLTLSVVAARDNSNTAATSIVTSDGSIMNHPCMIPVRSGNISLYTGANKQWWVLGYWEAGAVNWLVDTTGEKTVTVLGSGSGTTVHDFSNDVSFNATGVLVNHNEQTDGNCRYKWQWPDDPGYTKELRAGSSAYSTWNILIPFDPNSDQRIEFQNSFAGNSTLYVVAEIKQPMTVLWNPTSKVTGALPTSWGLCGDGGQSANGISCGTLTSTNTRMVYSQDSSWPGLAFGNAANIPYGFLSHDDSGDPYGYGSQTDTLTFHAFMGAFAASSDPAVATINGGSDVTPGQTNVAITGTDLDQGSGWTYGGAAVTLNTVTATTANIDAIPTTLKYTTGGDGIANTAYELIASTGTGVSAHLTPASGVFASEYSAGVVTGGLWDGQSTPVSAGDQVELNDDPTGGAGDERVTQLTALGHVTTSNADVGDVLVHTGRAYQGGSWDAFTYTATGATGVASDFIIKLDGSGVADSTNPLGT